MNVFAVFNAFKLAITTMAQHAFAVFQRKILKKARLLNVSIVVVMAALLVMFKFDLENISI